LVSALENLGYGPAQSAAAAEKVLAAPDALEASVATLIRDALRPLGPGGGTPSPADRAPEAARAGRTRPKGVM
ncbi:MAG: hypothetical protein L0027_13700, partial [Candidatus Rokubacteria bacterium]|nr:hypothetical protein [Candidatus Rokubacteria bacterium]